MKKEQEQEDCEWVTQHASTFVWLGFSADVAGCTIGQRERGKGAAEDWRLAKSLLLLLEMHKATGNVQVVEQEQGRGQELLLGRLTC